MPKEQEGIFWGQNEYSVILWTGVWVTQGMHLSKRIDRCTKDSRISLCVKCTPHKKNHTELQGTIRSLKC